MTPQLRACPTEGAGRPVSAHQADRTTEPSPSPAAPGHRLSPGSGPIRTRPHHVDIGWHQALIVSGVALPRATDPDTRTRGARRRRAAARTSSRQDLTVSKVNTMPLMAESGSWPESAVDNRLGSLARDFDLGSGVPAVTPAFDEDAGRQGQSQSARQSNGKCYSVLWRGLPSSHEACRAGAPLNHSRVARQAMLVK